MERNQFLEAHSREIIPGKPVILGAPLDLTATYRSGTDKAPESVREVSNSIESYSPFLDMDLVDFPFSDTGDIDFTNMPLSTCLDAIQSKTSHVLEAGCKPLSIGGEHTITLPIVHAVHDKHPDLVVIQADAHSDLRDEYEGDRINHATVMRRVAEIVGSDGLVQLGVRSGTKPEFFWMRSNATILPWEAFADKALVESVADRPVYLTIDVDVLDPALMPGTGNPEAGGWFYKDLERLLYAVSHVRLVGADVVELNPKLDASQSSSITTAKIIRELLLVLSS